ncbi:MAG: hypothetical protein IH996_00900 [Proteobacteria bacterium]|nr:hypothetical protein [Pseudomonadota bacterium]
MKYFRVLALLLAFAALEVPLFGSLSGQVWAQVQEDAGYLSALPDFPLMPGFSEQEETWVIFDKPGGRIVEAVFGGEALPAAVQDYYLGALPALGWRIESPAGEGLIFTREEERLVLTIGRQGNKTLVRLALAPIV